MYASCVQIEAYIEQLEINAALKKQVLKLFRDRWDAMHSPLHSAAYMLEPQFRGATFDRKVNDIADSGCMAPSKRY